ncbi:MAG: acetylornithine transaminase [Ruminococcus sp.]|nr:acetylornithine transaminase [Ruminococcus sp.]
MNNNNTDEMVKKANSSIMYTTNRPDVVFEKGEGSYLWDLNGDKYLDMIQGWAVCCLGHCAPVMQKALCEQSKLLINPSPSYYNVPATELADLLTRISCMDKVFFINSGAEANEGAVKLARKYGSKFKNGAYEIITAKNSFHGRTLAMMSASGKEKWKNLYSPKVDGFIWAEYNNIDAIKSNISDKTCAVMLELVQGEGGVIEADVEYVKEIRRLCDENDILLIIDEVQTGIGRLGTMFGYELYGIEPDIMTLAKGIGGGVPLSAVLAKDRVCCFDAGDQGGTYSMTPIATAVGLAVVNEIIDKDILGNVNEVGAYFRAELDKLVDEYSFVSGTRGKGLLLALALDGVEGSEIQAECFRNKLIINSPNKNTLRFMPALNLSKKEADECISILKKVLDKFN